MTGWCFLCTWPLIKNNADGKEVYECENCGRPTDQSHKICRTCRHNNFLADHADEIDLCLAHGTSVTKAIKLIKANGEIKCRCCGGSMKKSSRGRGHFCTQNKECRTAHRRMKYLIYDKNMSREDALNKVLRDLKEVD